MYSLRTKSEFDSAHFLKGYNGKCSNIHGHRWTVEIEIEVKDGELIKEGHLRGMIVDFSTLKDDLKENTDELDHSLIIEEGSLKENTVKALLEEEFKIVALPFRPTAENFSKYFYEKMKNKGYNVKCATVYETPNNCASYYE